MYLFHVAVGVEKLVDLREVGRERWEAAANEGDATITATQASTGNC